MIIPVHILTKRVLVSEYGSDQINVTSTCAILPLLISQPFKKSKSASLDDHITINCSDEKLLLLLREDAGHNLYLMHMHQFVQWMEMHTRLQVSALNAMTMYYIAIGLDIDELPPERIYKRWQRAVKQKIHGKLVVKSENYVLMNTTYRKRAVYSVLEYLARVVQSDPDMFFRATDDQPDESMIRKALMDSFKNCGWPQKEIAQLMRVTQQSISKGVRSYQVYLELKGKRNIMGAGRTRALLSYLMGADHK